MTIVNLISINNGPEMFFDDLSTEEKAELTRSLNGVALATIGYEEEYRRTDRA